MLFESANYLLQSKFIKTVNHLAMLVERYKRNKANFSCAIENDSLGKLFRTLKERRI